MKGSEEFKSVIKSYLDNRAAQDTLFALSYAKPNKSLDECVAYILGEVQKSGCNGFDDDEIYSMAMHYFDEDNIEVVKTPSNGRVVVNHHVELSEQEKQEAREAARKRFEDDCLAEMKNRNKRTAEQAKKAASVATKAEEEQPKQLSLFEL